MLMSFIITIIFLIIITIFSIFEEEIELILGISEMFIIIFDIILFCIFLIILNVYGWN